MINTKTFKLPGDATLRIRTDRIIATVHSNGSNNIEIYCSDAPIPFHVIAGEQTPEDITRYIWEADD